MQNLLSQESYEAKCVFNENGIVFFPVSQQHRDTKVEGISYDDDYMGNAVAAMVKPGRLEVRFHKAFSDQRIKSIWTQIRAEPPLAFLHGWLMVYQGREIL